MKGEAFRKVSIVRMLLVKGAATKGERVPPLIKSRNLIKHYQVGNLFQWGSTSKQATIKN